MRTYVGDVLQLFDKILDYPVTRPGHCSVHGVKEDTIVMSSKMGGLFAWLSLDQDLQAFTPPIK